jgi:hypothetical protein
VRRCIVPKKDDVLSLCLEAEQKLHAEDSTVEASSALLKALADSVPNGNTKLLPYHCDGETVTVPAKLVVDLYNALRESVLNTKIVFDHKTNTVTLEDPTS